MKIKIIILIITLVYSTASFSLGKIHEYKGFWELNTKDPSALELHLINGTSGKQDSLIQQSVKEFGTDWLNVALFHFSEGKPGYLKAVKALVRNGADPTFKFIVSEIGEVSSPIKVAFNSIKIKRHGGSYERRYAESSDVYELLSKSIQLKENIAEVDLILTHIEPYNQSICD